MDVETLSASAANEPVSPTSFARAAQELEALHSEGLQDAFQERSLLHEELRRLAGGLAEVTSEVEGLRRDCKTLLSSKANLDDQLELLRSRRDDGGGAAADASRHELEISALRADIGRERQARSSMEAMVAQCSEDLAALRSALDSGVLESKAAKENLSRLHARTQAIPAEIDAFQEKLEQEVRCRKSLEEALITLKRERSESLDAFVHEFETRDALRADEFRALQQRCEKLAAHQDSQHDSHRKDMASMQSELSQALLKLSQREPRDVGFPDTSGLDDDFRSIETMSEAGRSSCIDREFEPSVPSSVMSFLEKRSKRVSSCRARLSLTDRPAAESSRTRLSISDRPAAQSAQRHSLVSRRRSSILSELADVHNSDLHDEHGERAAVHEALVRLESVVGALHRDLEAVKKISNDRLAMVNADLAKRSDDISREKQSRESAVNSLERTLKALQRNLEDERRAQKSSCDIWQSTIEQRLGSLEDNLSVCSRQVDKISFEVKHIPNDISSLRDCLSNEVSERAALSDALRTVSNQHSENLASNRVRAEKQDAELQRLKVSFDLHKSDQKRCVDELHEQACNHSQDIASCEARLPKLICRIEKLESRYDHAASSLSRGVARDGHDAPPQSMHSVTDSLELSTQESASPFAVSPSKDLDDLVTAGLDTARCEHKIVRGELQRLSRELMLLQQDLDEQKRISSRAVSRIDATLRHTNDKLAQEGEARLAAERRIDKELRCLQGDIEEEKKARSHGDVHNRSLLGARMQRFRNDLESKSEDFAVLMCKRLSAVEKGEMRRPRQIAEAQPVVPTSQPATQVTRIESYSPPPVPLVSVTIPVMETVSEVVRIASCPTPASSAMALARVAPLPQNSTSPLIVPQPYRTPYTVSVPRPLLCPILPRGVPIPSVYNYRPAVPYQFQHMPSSPVMPVIYPLSPPSCDFVVTRQRRLAVVPPYVYVSVTQPPAPRIVTTTTTQPVVQTPVPQLRPLPPSPVRPVRRVAPISPGGSLDNSCSSIPPQLLIDTDQVHANIRRDMEANSQRQEGLIEQLRNELNERQGEHRRQIEELKSSFEEHGPLGQKHTPALHGKLRSLEDAFRPLLDEHSESIKQCNVKAEEARAELQAVIDDCNARLERELGGLREEQREQRRTLEEQEASLSRALQELARADRGTRETASGDLAGRVQALSDEYVKMLDKVDIRFEDHQDELHRLREYRGAEVRRQTKNIGDLRHELCALREWLQEKVAEERAARESGLAALHAQLDVFDGCFREAGETILRGWRVGGPRGRRRQKAELLAASESASAPTTAATLATSSWELGLPTYPSCSGDFAEGPGDAFTPAAAC
eukprot:TRINITY_DN14062_c0_g1_i1.p1 TRINITY_DN14062_c0_g1~~TRINITY_DN14062_c0_g1_i1.p1  ORF type:complete len:1344 (-),score=224.50 TRINITY_DN14062_c0_g1_i1:8-4018(-)